DPPRSVREAGRRVRRAFQRFRLSPPCRAPPSMLPASLPPFPEILIGFELPLRAFAAPISVRLEKRPPGLAERRSVADARPCAPAHRDARRIGELGIGVEIELLDQTLRDHRVIELAETVLQRRALAGVALDRRVGLKERAEEFGRIAHVFHGDAQRVPRLGPERAKMSPALAQLPVKPVETLGGEPDDRRVERADMVLGVPPFPP